MTTYITVCVILFGIDALCKMLVLWFGAQIDIKRSRLVFFLDASIGLGLFIWGLALLLK